LDRSNPALGRRPSPVPRRCKKSYATDVFLVGFCWYRRKKLRRCLTEEIARLGFAPVLGGELTSVFLCWL
jgi:hypothetical protein